MQGGGGVPGFASTDPGSYAQVVGELLRMIEAMQGDDKARLEAAQDAAVEPALMALMQAVQSGGAAPNPGFGEGSGVPLDDGMISGEA
jgi:hypothetical protein